MDWRLKFLKANLNSKESTFVKYKICMLKESQIHMTKFTEQTGVLTKNYSKLGKRIETIFALLDPCLPVDEAIAKHKEY
jgi:hypothetical protein